MLGYGRFLLFLDQRGDLDPTVSPGLRITRERLSAYLTELKRSNRGHTVQNRIQELGDAMRALVPERDWRWILRAAARLRASTTPVHDKRARLRPIEELIADGFHLMEHAEADIRLSHLARAIQYRDGLLIAFLGFHCLRLRNLPLQINSHIIENGQQFILRFSGSETKTGRPYDVPLAAMLVEPIRRYLCRHRPVLLQARGRWYAEAGNAFWISRHGSACSEDTFQNIIRKRTSGPGRLPLSPHLFRSCAATSIAVRAPGSVYIIPAVLGHSEPRTGEHYYNIATSLEASRAHNTLIEALRRQLGREYRRATRKKKPD
jgi:integrase